MGRVLLSQMAAVLGVQDRYWIIIIIVILVIAGVIWWAWSSRSRI